LRKPERPNPHWHMMKSSFFVHDLSRKLNGKSKKFTTKGVIVFFLQFLFGLKKKKKFSWEKVKIEGVE
jgi:hypothetical protein